MAGMVLRSRPAALDGSAMKLPVELRQVAQVQACPSQVITSNAPAGAVTPGSTITPSCMSPQSSGSSARSSSFFTAHSNSISCVSPRGGVELRRTLTTLQPAPGFTPHNGTTVTSSTLAGSPRASLVRTHTTSALPSPTADAAGTVAPLLQRTVSGSAGPTITTTVGAPMPSPNAAVTPASILRKYGPSPGMPYPPGMGFTPAAAKVGVLQRKISFGLSTGPPPEEGALVRRSSVASVAEEEGTIPRDMLLFYRWDAAGLAGEGLSAEQAGFLLPQPGWLRTQKQQDAAAEAAPAAPARASAPQAEAPAPAAAPPLQHRGAARGGGGQRKVQQQQQQYPQAQHHQQGRQQAGNNQEWWSTQEWWQWSAQQQQQQQQQQQYAPGGGGGGSGKGKGRGKGKHHTLAAR